MATFRDGFPSARLIANTIEGSGASLEISNLAVKFHLSYPPVQSYDRLFHS